ncbi:translation initiation factor IF-2-like [Felis catus]|uniref:translation initiation factor IF-2-like n=1 Tax=Felis catus TaxID=9685 RepID=UPI001D19DC0E|nr:translation initiation factor IF-2-like [Felis catus]
MGPTSPGESPSLPGRRSRPRLRRGAQDAQPPGDPKAHDLPRRDLPSCPEAPEGSGAGAAPPGAAVPEEPDLGLRDKFTSGRRPSRGPNRPPGASPYREPRPGRRGCKRAGPDPNALRRRRRPPGHSGPARGLRGSRLGVSARDSARPAQLCARWVPARTDGVQPRRPRVPCPPEAEAWEARPAVTWTRTGSESGAAALRVREHAH